MAQEDPDLRSRIMACVRSKDTKPEKVVRKILYSLGYRYRLNVNTISGSPDIVFKKKKKLIFIHGCFWHRHNCSSGKKMPKNNNKYWRDKFSRTQRRDADNVIKLKKEGWKILIVWECWLKDNEKLVSRLKHFMEKAP